jgi:uncharacterized membrane protein YbhN (UPF0104 family)
MSLPSGSRARRARRLVGPAVSALSLAAVVWWALHQQAPRWPTGTASWLLLGLAVLVYAGITMVRGLRWYLILRRAGVEASMADAQALTVVGYMGNTVLPARGGELLRLFMLGQRTGCSRVTILGTIVAERMIDLFALLMLLLLLAVVTATGVGSDSHVGAIAAIAAVTLFVPALALLGGWRLGRLARFRRLMARVSSLTLATRNLLSAQGLLLILLTGAIWMGEGLIYWLVGRAVHLHLNIWQGCFLVVLSSLVAIIPAAPGYAGTYDAAVQFGLRTLRVHGGQAISFGLLVRLVLFGPITVVGLILLVVRYGGLSALGRARIGISEPTGAPASTVPAR